MNERTLERKISLAKWLLMRFIRVSVPSARIFPGNSPTPYPSALNIRILAATDIERDKLKSDWNVDRRLRTILRRVNYPSRAIFSVTLMVESEETMARNYAASGWRSFY